MAESPNLLGEKITRLDAYDNRSIFIVSSEAYRDGLTGVFNEMRVWSILEDSRTQYNGATWDVVTEAWGTNNKYRWFLLDLPSSGQTGSAYNFLVGKAIEGVDLKSGLVEDL